MPKISPEHMFLLFFSSGVDETSLLKLMSQMQKLKSLCLSDTHLSDGALYSFRGSSLEVLDISNTMVSHQIYRNLVLHPYIFHQIY